jgi:hypothetical protein
VLTSTVRIAAKASSIESPRRAPISSRWRSPSATEWTPPTKRRPARIADLDPELHGLLTAIYADGASFKEQLALARRMLPLSYDGARA